MNWQRSSFCDNVNCVEVATACGVIYVRNSEHPDWPAVAFTEAEWTEFLRGVKAGEFG